jgi:hypothetical protein
MPIMNFETIKDHNLKIDDSLDNSFFKVPTILFDTKVHSDSLGFSFALFFFLSFDQL